MIDKQGNNIQIGDHVICLEPIEGFLVSTRIYEVKGLISEANRIIINPDERNLEGHYLAKRFLVIKTGESEIF